MLRPTVRKFAADDSQSDGERESSFGRKKGINARTTAAVNEKKALLNRKPTESFAAGSASLRDVIDLILKLLKMHELKLAVNLIERLKKTKGAQSLLEMTSKDIGGILVKVSGSDPEEVAMLACELDTDGPDKSSRLEGRRSRSPPTSPATSLLPNRRAQSPDSVVRMQNGGERSRPHSSSRPLSSPAASGNGVNGFDRSFSSHTISLSRPPSAAVEPPPLPPLPMQLSEFGFDDTNGVETVPTTVTTEKIKDLTDEETAPEPQSEKDTPIKDSSETQERWAQPTNKTHQLNTISSRENGEESQTVRFFEDDEEAPKKWKNQRTKSGLDSSFFLNGMKQTFLRATQRLSTKDSAELLERRQKQARNRDRDAEDKMAEPTDQFATPIAGANNETWWAIRSHRFIVSPNGLLRIVWDLLSLLAIINEAIIVPMALLFDFQTPEAMFLTSTVFFTMDLVLNFFTGYFADGILVMKQHYIIWHYLRTWFPLDAVSTFPWQLVFSGGNATMLKLAKFGKVMRVVRLLRVAKMGMLLEHLQDLFASPALIVGLKLCKIVCFIAMMCHWVACFWGWLGHPDQFQGDLGFEPHNQTKCEPGGPCEPSIMGSAWRRRYGLEEEDKIEQYLVALRFASGLFTGNDMGLQPGFWLERVFLIFMFFASMILGSTVISNIVMIFEGMRQERQEQDELMMSFKQFMSASNVPFELQSKIKRYLDFQFKSRKELQVRRNELMQRLSPWLRKELQVHLNSNVLIQHRFFRDMPSEILAHMCCLALSDISAPGDIIVQHGQNLPVIMFVVKGRLTVKLTKDDSPPKAWEAQNANNPGRMSMKALRKSLSKSQQFPNDDTDTVLSAPGFIGASSLFRDEVRPYTVSSLSNSELLKLAREDIDALLQEFPALGIYIQHYVESCESTEEGFQDCSIQYIAQVCEVNSTKATDMQRCMSCNLGT